MSVDRSIKEEFVNKVMCEENGYFFNDEVYGCGNGDLLLITNMACERTQKGEVINDSSVEYRDWVIDTYSRDETKERLSHYYDSMCFYLGTLYAGRDMARNQEEQEFLSSKINDLQPQIERVSETLGLVMED